MADTMIDRRLELVAKVKMQFAQVKAKVVLFVVASKADEWTVEDIAAGTNINSFVVEAAIEQLADDGKIGMMVATSGKHAFAYYRKT